MACLTSASHSLELRLLIWLDEARCGFSAQQTPLSQFQPSPANVDSDHGLVVIDRTPSASAPRALTITTNAPQSQDTKQLRQVSNHGSRYVEAQCLG